MKNIAKTVCIAILAVSLFAACNKEECYKCTDCTGTFANFDEQEFCSEGFDNKDDWEKSRKDRESRCGSCPTYNP